jgi:tRNA pseudouridine13 synthase
MNVLDAEKKVGIETFYTSFEGIDGKLRVIPQDFKVDEISDYPLEEKKGKFTIGDVTSINWETNKLIRDISNRLGISRNRINFAGTKDKRAETTQVLSFYKVSKENIERLNLKDVKIKNIYFSNKPVKIGTLKGNKFDINIRNIKFISF